MPERYRVLVVGGGSIGERHVRCFRQTGRAQVSLCEIDADVRSAVASRNELDASYAVFDDAIAAAPDVAVICTPAHLHIPMAQAAIEAGIHVLIEKPLSTSLDGIARLQETVVAREIVAGVAYVYRAHPALQEMRDAITGGRFGPPVEIVAVLGQHFPFYRPAYRTIYYRDRKTGGGAIQDALTHVLNAGEWLVGPVTRLVCDAGHLVLEGVDVEDTVHLLARHGPVMGSYSLNQHQSPNESTITVVCQHGTARFEMHRHRWQWCDEPGGDWKSPSALPLERDTLFVRQASNFLDAAGGAATPLCSLAEGLQTLRVNLAALASSESLAWQTIPAENERFPHGP